MTHSPDRLYEILPSFYRQRDAEQGYPLRALLRVVTDQADVVDDDISQLYENWFIETCEDWVVPYIGDLVGYVPVHEAGEPSEVVDEIGRLQGKILVPRREVANMIRNRRRKGTLAQLEQLARDVAGWPARAVEFYRLLCLFQALDHIRLRRGRTVDVRDGDSLEHIDGPFDQLAHSVNVRRISSHRTRGRYGVPSIGLFAWRLRTHSVTEAPAYCVDPEGGFAYTFNVLGSDVPLFTRPESEESPSDIAGAMNVPAPISRRALERHLEQYYGEGKSLQLWRDGPPGDVGAATARQSAPTGAPTGEPIELDQIVVADLTDWQYEAAHDTVAVDPVLGRVAFPTRHPPQRGLWVSYRYGFSADIGGGEYRRRLSQPREHVVYRVGRGEDIHQVSEAINDWRNDLAAAHDADRASLSNAVVEITDSGAYVERIDVTLETGESLQVRAASGARPVIRQLDFETGRPDAVRFTLAPGSRLKLDGLFITGRGVKIGGTEEVTADEDPHDDQQPQAPEQAVRPLADVRIRHCTLVPGWSSADGSEPSRWVEASLECNNIRARVHVAKSVVGTIQINLDQVMEEPLPLHVRDSVVDATSTEREAVGAAGELLAHAVLTMKRCTVIGKTQVHAIELAENSIFVGKVKVGRRQRGCVRFSYVSPDSRTPQRFNCQPDLVDRSVTAEYPKGPARDSAMVRERIRVRPRFNGVRYGMPTYCQLSLHCAAEIVQGADDESEMGVFHHLHQPQRTMNLRARLDEYTPAGMDAGIIFAN